MKKIIDCETGETLERELNAEELAQQEIDEGKIATVQIEKEAKAAQKAALLERLGISESEARLLLS